MKRYKVSFVFFISCGDTEQEYNESITEVNQHISWLNQINDNIKTDCYDDGYDWNVECVLEIEAPSVKKVKVKMEEILKASKYDFQYHYIKCLD